MLTACANIALFLGSLLAGDVEQDPAAGAAEAFSYSFETPEDRNYDLQPDGWSRRKGEEFPGYVEAKIDPAHAFAGTQSLQMKANGGNAIYYSPPVRIDSLYSYVFRGRIRTQDLDGDAALISVSLLNHKRQRVQRLLTVPVTGTHTEWIEVRLGPLLPDPSVHFVVFGCHLLRGETVNMHGSAWFDDLWLGRLPQLTLESNVFTHFRQQHRPLEITSRVSGLDPGHAHQLELQLIDGDDAVVQTRSFPIREASADSSHEAAVAETLVWSLSELDYGFYRVRSTLERDGTSILERETSFVVVDLAEDGEGEFGWTIHDADHGVPLEELPGAARQAGINWLKYPLWQSASSGNSKVAAQLAEAFEALRDRRIAVVGMLNDPPPELRRKFAEKWSGLSELFAMPPAFWSRSIDLVIARYSSLVRNWQLGDEDDASFFTLASLPETVNAIQEEFDRIGRDTRIGVHWPPGAPLPHDSKLRRMFVSVHDRTGEGKADSAAARPLRNRSAIATWTVIKPLPKGTASRDVRGADLVMRMVAAKVTGAEAIFAYNVFDPECGLLNNGGSPTVLFLPWRTTALALRGKKFLGSVFMPGGSSNFVFMQPGEVVLVVWNDEPTTESLYLGEQVTITDIWGRPTSAPTDPETGEQTIEAGPMPLIIRGCSEPIARWCLAARYAIERLESAYGDQQQSIEGSNTFPQSVSGKVSLNAPSDWGLEPGEWEFQLGPGQDFKLPLQIRLPPNASIGREKTTIDFDIMADRRYRFRIYRPIDVGLGDVGIHVSDRKLPDGRLEVTQVIVNQTNPAEILNFHCTLSAPGRRRQRLSVMKLGLGEDSKLYHLPDADSLRGRELWVRAEEIGGRRILNFRWTVGENWSSDRSAARLRWPQSTAERLRDDADRR